MTIHLELDTTPELLEFSGQAKIKDTNYKFKSSYELKANLKLDCHAIFCLHKNIIDCLNADDPKNRTQDSMLDDVSYWLNVLLVDYPRESLEKDFNLEMSSVDNKISFTLKLELKCNDERILNFIYSLGEKHYTDFYRGIRAAADYLFMRAANCFHPSYPKESEIEDNVLHDAAKTILYELSPDDYCKWKEIGDLHKQLKEHETKIENLEDRLEELRHIENLE